MISSIGFRANVSGKTTVDINQPVKRIGLHHIPLKGFDVDKIEIGTIFKNNEGEIALVAGKDVEEGHIHIKPLNQNKGDFSCSPYSLANKYGCTPICKISSIKIGD